MRLNISTLILPRHVSTEVEAAMTECLMYETERCGLVAPGHHCVEDSEVLVSSYSASMSAAAAAAVAGARRATKSGASPGASTNNGSSSGSGGGGGGGDSSQLVRSKSVLLRESLEEALVGALPLPPPAFPTHTANLQSYPSSTTTAVFCVAFLGAGCALGVDACGV